LCAFIAEALELFGIIELSLGEQIILILVGLLAIDALTERLTVLEGIKNEIKSINIPKSGSKYFLKHRKDLPKLEERLENAKALDICGHSLLAISTQNTDLIQEKLKSGCDIRALILNSSDEKLMEMSCNFVGDYSPTTLAREIRTSISSFLAFPKYENSGTLEIRIYDYPLAHNILIVNGLYENGNMRVEPYITKRRAPTNPGFDVHKSDDPVWFEVFYKEFNDQWDMATPLNDVISKLGL